MLRFKYIRVQQTNALLQSKCTFWCIPLGNTSSRFIPAFDQKLYSLTFSLFHFACKNETESSHNFQFKFTKISLRKKYNIPDWLALNITVSTDIHMYNIIILFQSKNWIDKVTFTVRSYCSYSWTLSRLILGEKITCRLSCYLWYITKVCYSIFESNQIKYFFLQITKISL